MNIIEKNFKTNGNMGIRKQTNRIILHHAAAINCTVEDIDKWHKDKGWCKIGYHFFIDKQGNIYRGREENAVGAHATGHNTCSIGVCFEGNFEVETMSEVQMKAGAELVAYLKDKYNINLVQKHKDVNATSCPGTNFPFGEIVNGKAPTQAETTSQNKILDIFHDGKINCIYDIQEWLNNKYGANLILDNIYGPETHKALVKALQHELNVQFNAGLVEDGIFGNNTYNACITVRQGASGNITMLIQMALFIKGYNIEMDKEFGADTANKVYDFQSKNGLVADKMVGKDTFRKLFA